MIFLSLGDSFKKTINLIPLWQTFEMLKTNSIQRVLINVAGNIILFIPLGILVPLMYKNGESLKKISLYGFIGSLAIESSQYLLSIRITDIDDIIFNTIGAVTGYIAFIFFKRNFRGSILWTFIKKYQDRKIIFIAIKPLAVIIILSICLTLGVIYKNTYPDNLANEEIAKQFYKHEDYYIVASKDYESYKSIVISWSPNGDEIIEIENFRRIFGSRYFNVDSSQLFLRKYKNGYSYSIKRKSENDWIFIVYGKNSIASKVLITYGKKEYMEDISACPYFIVVYPYSVSTYTDMKNIIVKFLDRNGRDVTDKFYMGMHLTKAHTRS